MKVNNLTNHVYLFKILTIIIPVSPSRAPTYLPRSPTPKPTPQPTMPTSQPSSQPTSAPTSLTRLVILSLAYEIHFNSNSNFRLMI